MLLLSVKISSADPITLQGQWQGGVGRIEICVMPFKAGQDSAFAGALPKTVRDLVNDDLAHSGYFNMVQPESLPPDTNMQVRRFGNKLDTLITYTGSTAVRVQGNIIAQWSGITANISLFQPPLKDPIHAQSFQFKAEEERIAAHKISAWITKMLTGEEGAYNTQIVFTVRNGQNKELYLMDWDGSNPRKITSDNTINMSPSWSPDGNSIYFTSFKNGNADIFKLDLASGKSRSFIASPQYDSAPCVSADGQFVAYSSSSDGNAEIYRIGADGSGKVQLTVNYGIDTSPSWSPTGQQLCFTSDRSGRPQIYKMDADGVDAQRITFQGDYNESAKWSPRGDLIAYVSREIKFQIFTIAPDGTKDRRVTDDGSNCDPSWSPDGMKIVYTSTRNNKPSIWVCNWDGSDPRELTKGLEASQPQWGPARPLALDN